VCDSEPDWLGAAVPVAVEPPASGPLAAVTDGPAVAAPVFSSEDAVVDTYAPAVHTSIIVAAPSSGRPVCRKVHL